MSFSSTAKILKELQAREVCGTSQYTFKIDGIKFFYTKGSYNSIHCRFFKCHFDEMTLTGNILKLVRDGIFVCQILI